MEKNWFYLCLFVALFGSVCTDVSNTSSSMSTSPTTGSLPGTAKDNSGGSIKGTSNGSDALTSQETTKVTDHPTSYSKQTVMVDYSKNGTTSYRKLTPKVDVFKVTFQWSSLFDMLDFVAPMIIFGSSQINSFLKTLDPQLPSLLGRINISSACNQDLKNVLEELLTVFDSAGKTNGTKPETAEDNSNVDSTNDGTTLKPTPSPKFDSTTLNNQLSSLMLNMLKSIMPNTKISSNQITSFLDMLMEPRTNTTPTSLQSWAVALKGKLPAGFDMSVLDNLRGILMNTPDIGKLFTLQTLGPQLPSVLREILSNNMSSACNRDLKSFLETTPNITRSWKKMMSFFNTLIGPRPNITKTQFPSLPSWAGAMKGKIPAGFDTSVLNNLLRGNMMNTTDIGKLFTTLGPQLPSLLRGITKNKSTCSQDLEYFSGQLLMGKMWALKMMDAAGKPGPTILEGNLNFLGDFDECLSVVSDLNPVTGRVVSADTCTVSIGVPASLLANMPVQTNPLGGPLAVNWQICVPKTCGSKTIQEGVQKALSSLQLTVHGVLCHEEIKLGPVGEDMKAVGAIILTSILAALVLLGSALDLSIRGSEGSPDADKKPDLKKLHDIYKHVNTEKLDETSLSKGNGHVTGGLTNGGFINGDLENGKANGENGHAVAEHPPVKEQKGKPAKRNLCTRLLLCFSAVTNAEKVLSVKNTPGSLNCLNGIRVLSIGWVLLGHSFFFLISAVDNPMEAYRLVGTFNFQCILNGTLSVDSFFVLSGLLGTFLFLREIEKAGGLKVKHMIMYYIHRYLRLTPAYAFTLFLYMFLVPYMADGSTWTGMLDKQSCLKTWWVNLLYINNVYHLDDQCFGWAWFLANDMQFYVIAPVFLIPFAIGIKGSPKSIANIIGSIMTVVLIFLGIGATAGSALSIGGDIFTNDSKYFNNIYVAPWCRVSTFAIGVAAGYFLHKTKADFKMSYFVQGVGWLLALIVAMACNFATYDANAPGRRQWGLEAKTAHETLFRPAWACVLSWVIIMCCSGKGGIVNWMLSWAWWQPLARLTYGAYLIHPILMLMASLLVRSLIHFSAPWIVLLFFGFTGVSYALAFVLSMLVEAPMLNLEKILLGR